MSNIKDEVVVSGTPVVTGKGSVGNQRFDSDIMVGVMDSDKEFYDFFMTNDQAEDLGNLLLRMVKLNKEG